MKINSNNYTHFFIIGIIFLLGCSSSQNSINRNVAGIYIPGLNLIDPTYKVFHKNDTLTEFYFQLNSKDILYAKRRGDSTFKANILVKYELKDLDLKALVDSASNNFSDSRVNKENNYLDGKINLPTLPNKSYSLEITFSDVTRDQSTKRRIKIDRSSLYNDQNFLLLDTFNNVLFKNHFNINDKVVIQKNEYNTKSDIDLKFYESNYPIAKPPFSIIEQDQTEPFLPKSVDSFKFDSSNTFTYTITKKGIYHFEQEGSKFGPTLFSFQDNFPEIKNQDNMIGPMRYISTTKEFSLLKESSNKKDAIDKFWLTVAGSTDRARTLIREYYNRVKDANNYFTSYMEGWKTDRGIIYIIYGTPNVVYKKDDYENWIYGEENNVTSLSFVFRKTNNPISPNDFILSRSPIFKNSWFRAVDSWRNGRIY